MCASIHVCVRRNVTKRKRCECTYVCGYVYVVASVRVYVCVWCGGGGGVCVCACARACVCARARMCLSVRFCAYAQRMNVRTCIFYIIIFLIIYIRVWHPLFPLSGIKEVIHLTIYRRKHY